MKLTWRIMVVLSFCAADVHADPPPSGSMSWAFGNTLKQEIPGQGYTAQRFINPDGTWTEMSTFGESKGRWSIDNDKVCFEQFAPAPDPRYERLCYDAQHRSVGDKWINIDPVTLNEVVITLVAGRQ